MQLLGSCRLVDVLGDWGSYNSTWRWGPVGDVGEGSEMVLISYPDMMRRILAAEPVVCFRALFDAGDISQIVTHRGESLTRLAAAKSAETYVSQMVNAPPNVTGPLICTCAGDLINGEFKPRSSIVLFDGWHRGAAWALHQQAGRSYRITARVIVTKRDVSVMGQS